MKCVPTILLGLSLMGCASQQPAVNLDNADSAIMGEKPEGYPKTFIKRLPDLPGFCIEVTEDWRKHPYQGDTIWLKEKTIKSLNCPETSFPGSTNVLKR